MNAFDEQWEKRAPPSLTCWLLHLCAGLAVAPSLAGHLSARRYESSLFSNRKAAGRHPVCIWLRQVSHWFYIFSDKCVSIYIEPDAALALAHSHLNGSCVEFTRNGLIWHLIHVWHSRMRVKHLPSAQNGVSRWKENESKILAFLPLDCGGMGAWVERSVGRGLVVGGSKVNRSDQWPGVAPPTAGRQLTCRVKVEHIVHGWRETAAAQAQNATGPTKWLSWPFT